MEILLDCDGVLADFITPLLGRLNAATGKNLSMADYSANKTWHVDKVYGITDEEFWRIAEEGDNLWNSLLPYPWAHELFDFCNSLGRVTICTSPSNNPICALQKTQWLFDHFGLTPESIMLGRRKELMANPGTTLIDDSPTNIKKFQAAGGIGVLVPSEWNKYPLTYEDVRKAIDNQLKKP